MKLRSDIRAKALLRTAQSLGGMGYLARRGHETAGVIYLVIMDRPGAAVLFQSATNMDGRAVWRCPMGGDPTPEGEISAWLDKESGFDPDFWHLEVEGVTQDALLDAPFDDPDGGGDGARPSVAAADAVFRRRT